MFKEGQLVCRTNKVLADDRADFLSYGFNAVRLEDALNQNDDARIFDIKEDFIGIFLRYDPEYSEYSHVLYGEEILLVRNSYLIPYVRHVILSGSAC